MCSLTVQLDGGGARASRRHCRLSNRLYSADAETRLLTTNDRRLSVCQSHGVSIHPSARACMCRCTLIQSHSFDVHANTAAVSVCVSVWLWRRRPRHRVIIVVVVVRRRRRQFSTESLVRRSQRRPRRFLTRRHRTSWAGCCIRRTDTLGNYTEHSHDDSRYKLRNSATFSHAASFRTFSLFFCCNADQAKVSRKKKKLFES